MQYEEFKKRLIDAIIFDCREKGFSDVEIVNHEVNKVNESHDCLIIGPKNSDVCPSIAADVFFEAYENGMQVEEVIAKAVSVVSEALAMRPEIPAESFSDYGAVKNRLLIEVIPASENKDFLKDVPHYDIEDLSVIYRIMVSSDGLGIASAFIKNDMMESWKISLEQLHKDALKNSERIQPAEITPIIEILKKQLGISCDDSMDFDLGMPQLYVATNKIGHFGAGVIAYEGFFENASVSLGTPEPVSFFILPSSIHELILLRENDAVSIDDLKSMVRNVNETEVSKEDFLSNTVYHYDCDLKIFEKADDYVIRKNCNQASLCS